MVSSYTCFIKFCFYEAFIISLRQPHKQENSLYIMVFSTLQLEARYIYMMGVGRGANNPTL
jgi:hypothetical protein